MLRFFTIENDFRKEKVENSQFFSALRIDKFCKQLYNVAGFECEEMFRWN